MSIALVVPTIREDSFKQFYERWNKLGLFDHVDLFVLEDNPTQTFKMPNDLQVDHMSWKNIDEDLKENSWIIPRRSDTVRSYAYYKVWKEGYDYILTLDDDCYPYSEEVSAKEQLIDYHLSAINGKTRWFNTLNDVTPRGIPYYNHGQNNKVVLNHGLWTKVLDYDAPHQLVQPSLETFSFDNKIVPSNMYFPMCGMNVMWKAEITVLMYHLLMGRLVEKHEDGTNVTTSPNNPVITKLPFDRFGDIWCGILMKKVIDQFGFNASTGTPYITHERASNPFTNLRKEANGIEVNEKFWSHVDNIDLRNTDSLTEAYSKLGNSLKSFGQVEYKNDAEFIEYFNKLSSAMVIWSSLFEKGK